MIHTSPFYYQMPWKSASVHLGDHAGVQRGLGDEFRNHVSLLDYPDLRRLDFRQTMCDPFEQIQVRVFNQKALMRLYAMCDLSSSMQFSGQISKLARMQEVVASIACSAHENGDLFGMVTYDQVVIDDLTMPASHHVHQSLSMIEKMIHYKNKQVNGSALFEAIPLTGQEKSLVFWVSDFHMPFILLERALNLLANHQLIPIVLWDRMEYERLPRFGLGQLQDMETGTYRTIFFRPAIRLRFAEMFAQRKQALSQLFARFDVVPIYLEYPYDPRVISNYFEHLAS